EARYRVLQLFAHPRQFGRGALRVVDPRVGLLRARRQAGDAARDRARPGCRLGDVAVHLVRRRRLLLHRGRDSGLDVTDPVDDRTDLPDRLHRARRVALDRVDLGGDVLGGAGGLLGQLLDLARDDGEPLAGLAGAG